MHFIFPLLSLASLVLAVPSPSESLVWSKVDTAKPSSTSSLVWSKVNTAKPSPLTTTTTFPSWSRVIRTRTSSSTSSSSTPSSTPSLCPKLPLNYTLTKPACFQNRPLEWFNIDTYLNYRESGAAQYNNTLVTNGTGWYSGSAAECPGLVIDSNADTLSVSVSEELAAQFGGMKNMCGKKLLIMNGDIKWGSPGGIVTPSRAIVVRSCSPKFCPGKSLGIGRNWTAVRGAQSEWGLNLWRMFYRFPAGLHHVVENTIAWVDWDNSSTL
ncbi:uncharacterized protein JCM6883_000185 [Sporobolomyces salmoneus]|uniref:uncharacterized protein n=1 Tax=Sporobolomyces salmoneus TaxID=183962 RepID=UPI003172529E